MITKFTLTKNFIWEASGGRPLTRDGGVGEASLPWPPSTPPLLKKFSNVRVRAIRWTTRHTGGWRAERLAKNANLLAEMANTARDHGC